MKKLMVQFVFNEHQCMFINNQKFLCFLPFLCFFLTFGSLFPQEFPVMTGIMEELYRKVQLRMKFMLLKIIT